MTTTVTVKTHDWPVEAYTSSTTNFASSEVRREGYATTTEFVPAHSERSFYLSDSASVSLRELPIGTEGLPQLATDDF
jgi:hypothetical protein